ncbi:hypothetical protein JOE40_000688 [Arthrobacter sp. PvP102]|uniref:hypothetical protein n=1 Tax=unclassified Arthrobacter TaxID=235627 RepID=UPI001AE73C32|nr:MULTISPECIES: hypothetical protein [unclassified Arthrobacter]MBP1235220.1 hypothetical protein [Arthrobacter sp. PvP103]MBP1236179.1 hypothetical protein [Arthrobacter sp. PvP102]
MDTNPVLKPKLATPALILSSVAITACVVYLIGAAAASGPDNLFLLLTAAITLLAAVVAGTVWLVRARRLRSWMAGADELWDHFNEMRRSSGTTAEITVVSIDALEPTGSWITIKWNRFDHVQRAWIEALPEPIWPGSVLLISPDPAQVRPGEPWPATYYVRASDSLAWAPGSEA